MSARIAPSLRRFLLFAFLCLAATSAVVAFFLPMYTDELLWKLEDGALIGTPTAQLSLALAPSCGGYEQDIPLLILPMRRLGRLLNTLFATPLTIRIFGCVLETVWLALTVALIRYAIGTRVAVSKVAIGLIAFSTLGVMPFLLEMSRPEQFLLISVTAFFLPLLRETRPVHRGLPTSVAILTGIFVVSGFLTAMHPRGVFALPLVGLIAYRLTGRIRLAGVCLLLSIIYSAVAYQNWSSRWVCAGDPVIAAKFLRLNIGANFNSQHIGRYFAELFATALSGNGWFIDAVIPKVFYTAEMIPGIRDLGSFVFGQILEFWLAALCILGLCAAVAGGVIRWHEPTARVSILGVASVWLFCAASFIARIDKNDYEASLMMPLLGLAVLGSFIIARPVLLKAFGETQARRLAQGTFISLLIFSVLSQIDLIANDAPQLSRNWSQPGYPSDQKFSVSLFGMARLKPQILAAAAKCGITPADHPNRLVVDELTYFAFRDDARAPYFMTYLDEHGWSAHRPDPTAILHKYRSSGMIIGCQWVPTVYRSLAIRDGAFCCMPAFR